MLDPKNTKALDNILANMPRAMTCESTFSSIFLNLSAFIEATEYLVCHRTGRSSLVLPIDDTTELEKSPLLSKFGGPEHMQLYFRIEQHDHWGSREQAVNPHEVILMSDVTASTLGEHVDFDTWLEHLDIKEVVFVKLFEMPIGCVGLNFFFPKKLNPNDHRLKLIAEMSRRITPFLEPYFKGYCPAKEVEAFHQVKNSPNPTIQITPKLEVKHINSSAMDFLGTTLKGRGAKVFLFNDANQLLLQRYLSHTLEQGCPHKFTILNPESKSEAILHICIDDRSKSDRLLLSFEIPDDTSSDHIKLLDLHLMNFAKYIGIVQNEKRPPLKSIAVLKFLVLRFTDDEICDELSMKSPALRHHIETVILPRMRTHTKRANLPNNRSAVPSLYEAFLNNN